MNPLLSVVNLEVRAKNSPIINGANFSVFPHEIVALVGESGSGKSMIARCIMGLFPSTAIRVTGGSIHFQEQDLLSLPENSLRELRGSTIAYIPQSPLNALNPIMSIGRQLTEGYRFRPQPGCPSAREKALFLLKRVGFLQPELAMLSLPHQLSGGMRQRVLIAMALMNSPRFLIADEPTTALDVTLQAEILDVLLDLKNEYGLSVLLITHDLGIVAKSANRVVILQAGKTIEEGSLEDIFYKPKAQYTKTLLESLMTHPSSSLFI